MGIREALKIALNNDGREHRSVRAFSYGRGGPYNDGTRIEIACRHPGICPGCFSFALASEAMPDRSRSGATAANEDPRTGGATTGGGRRQADDAGRSGAMQRLASAKHVVHSGYTWLSCVAKLLVQSERTADGPYYSSEL